jgi:hypothetical protein
VSGSSDPVGRAPDRRFRLWKVGDDDLLAGLDREGRPHGLRAFFATTLAGSLFLWQIAFALGAYHTVFYSRLFAIVVVSTVMLLGSIVVRHTVKVRWWTRPALALPLVWLISRWLWPLGRGTRPAQFLDDILVGLTVASVPLTILAVARVMAPEYFALGARRLKVAAVIIMAIVFVGGVLTGQYNYRVTDCEQYILAGDDEPANCHAPPPSPSPSPSP